MTDLQKEAEEYARKMWGTYFYDKHPDIAIEQTQGEITIQDYISGATQSKHVQAEKLKAQIDLLKRLGHLDESISENYVYILIELEQQLNQLTNAKN